MRALVPIGVDPSAVADQKQLRAAAPLTLTEAPAARVRDVVKPTQIAFGPAAH